MQYFQKANSKQIVGHAATTPTGSFDDPAWTEDRAGAALRATSAIARATSILFMTVSFWKAMHSLLSGGLLPDRYASRSRLPTSAADRQHLEKLLAARIS